MKMLLAAILLIGFVSLAVFGFAEVPALGSHAGGTHRTCLASAVQGIDCPNKLSNFGSAFFHIAAFKFFSTLTLETILWLLAILASLATVFLASVLGSRLAPAPISNFQLLPRSSSRQVTRFSSLLLSWLALKELSPTR